MCTNNEISDYGQHILEIGNCRDTNNSFLKAIKYANKVNKTQSKYNKAFFLKHTMQLHSDWTHLLHSKTEVRLSACYVSRSYNVLDEATVYG